MIEVDFYITVTRKKMESGTWFYKADHFRQYEPDDTSGHVVHVTLKVDPAVFSSEVTATAGLDIEGFKEVVRDLKDI